MDNPEESKWMTTEEIKEELAKHHGDPFQLCACALMSVLYQHLDYEEIPESAS